MTSGIYFFFSACCCVAYSTSLHVCVCIGGLLHCDLPLSDADCAVDQRAHPAWCWDWHQVLPLSRPGTSGGPAGIMMSNKLLQNKAKNVLIDVYFINLSWRCDYLQTVPQQNSKMRSFRRFSDVTPQVQVSHGSRLGSLVSAGSICSPWKRWGLQGSNTGPGHHRNCKHKLYQGRDADSRLTSLSPSGRMRKFLTGSAWLGLATVQSEEMRQSPLVNFSCISRILIVSFCFSNSMKKSICTLKSNHSYSLLFPPALTVFIEGRLLNQCREK